MFIGLFMSIELGYIILITWVTFCIDQIFLVLTFACNIVATLLLEVWEDDTHTPKMGTWESTGTPETSKFDRRGQNTLH
jgi:hypothetical protein